MNRSQIAIDSERVFEPFEFGGKITTRILEMEYASVAGVGGGG